MQVDRLMHVVLDLLMCKTVELLASQKSIFSVFPVMKGLNKSKKKKKKNLKIIQNLNLQFNHFSNNFNEIRLFFSFFTKTLTLLFPPAYWADDNFDLSLNNNILKMVTVNIAALTRMFLKEYSIIF